MALPIGTTVKIIDCQTAYAKNTGKIGKITSKSSNCYRVEWHEGTVEKSDVVAYSDVVVHRPQKQLRLFPTKRGG